MARNVYDFDDAGADEQQLDVIAKKLQGKTPKDVLLKQLKVWALMPGSWGMNAKSIAYRGVSQ